MHHSKLTAWHSRLSLDSSPALRPMNGINTYWHNVRAMIHYEKINLWKPMMEKRCCNVLREPMVGVNRWRKSILERSWDISLKLGVGANRMISVTNHGLNRPLEAAATWQRIRVAPRITLVPYYGGSMRIGSFLCSCLFATTPRQTCIDLLQLYWNLWCITEYAPRNPYSILQYRIL